MEGSGVTNYSVDKPSYGFTTATTQFDDALLQHGVVNRTQTIVAKGATVAQAQELLQTEAAAKEARANTVLKRWDDNSEEEEDDNDDDDDEKGESGDEGDSYDDLLDDQDDEILQRYRQLRLEEWKEQQEDDKSRGIVESISRDDWTPKVNEASRDGTHVVICLTTSSARHEFLDACTVLAQRHRTSLFVTLPAKEALSTDWPHPEPSILVYRYGKLRHEFFRLTALSVEDLEATLSEVWKDE
eukprot:scaffold6764_cov169-Amphora_coffeaeformis.AAC.4